MTLSAVLIGVLIVITTTMFITEICHNRGRQLGVTHVAAIALTLGLTWHTTLWALT